MDTRLFDAGPFVVLGADNARVATAEDAAAAWRLLRDRREAVSVVGTLRPMVHAADVDPTDVGADPEAGVAVADELVAWCERRGLPWLVRASGRPGGRHVLVAAPADVHEEWRQLCTQLAVHHGVSVTARTSLRLLSAPHRAGLPAPVLAGTLRPGDLPPADGARHDEQTHGTKRCGRRRARSLGHRSVDRSRVEFGDALARARAGWTATKAWAAANVAGSKAAELGETAWRRWVWCKAVTIAAAEQQASEAEAWRRFRRASQVRARDVGITGFRARYWNPAQAEAASTRPRRTRTTREATTDSGPDDEADLIRAGLRAACDHQASQAGLRPQRARSIAALLDALAEVIAHREGSISDRAWAERARLDPKTLRAARTDAIERGLLRQTRNYQGGPHDSAAWQPGPVAQAEIDRLRKTSTTRGTPPPPARGQANPTLLRRRHHRDRQLWHLRCSLSASTETTGQTYATSAHPAAKTLRSLRHQRRWWANLTPQQQQERRHARRVLLGQMHRSERRAWLDWLARREALTTAAERARAGTAADMDQQVLAEAPRTVHMGMHDPQWRHASQAAVMPGEPTLSLAA